MELFSNGDMEFGLDQQYAAFAGKTGINFDCRRFETSFKFYVCLEAYSGSAVGA